MAEHRRFADLNYGHAGLLTYIPPHNPEDGPGVLHTSRLVTNTPNFKIVGSSAELYPPAKLSLPEASAALWKERQVQQRWLLKSHPEAFVGGSTACADFLKEDMDRFETSDAGDNDGPLLAVGEMTDLRDMSNIKALPLLAVATGKSGQQLRLARMDESQWQWGDHKDAVLNLSVIDSIHQEEETIWTGDGLPISKIKFATSYWQRGSVRWLLVQNKTSVTILQPEYHRIPLPDSGGSSSTPRQPPSYITANPLITLHHHQTGGNAFSDVCFNPPLLGSPPQITVMDECGYWSVWSVLGTWQVAKKTLRLSLYKCGHIFEGILGEIPRVSSHQAQKHGMLHIGRNDRDEGPPVTTKRAEDIKRTLGPSQHVLVWNSERISLVDLESDSVLPKVDVLVQSRTRPDWILDIQRSMANEDHVFVLTARQIIWVNLLPRSIEPETSVPPRILLTCSHVGFGNEDSKMFVCQVSENKSDGSMVFIHSPSTDQLAVYWFTFSSDTRLPQWHRHITALPTRNKRVSSNTAQSIRVQSANLMTVAADSEPGPGTNYAQTETKFYQVTILDEDLSVRYCIFISSIDAALEVTLPTSRVGWSKSDDRRRWKQRRKHFLRHMGDTFVLPDDMTDDHLDLLLKEQEPRLVEEETSDGDGSTKPRPVVLKFGRISQTISSRLQTTISEGEHGLPAQLVDAVRGLIERGEVEGWLPLTSWLDVISSLEQGATFERAGEDMETDIEGLLEDTDEHVVVAQLRRQHSNEPPNSLVSYSFLEEQFSELWLQPVAESLSKEAQQLRKVWVAEIARDVFLSSYGVMVQDVPLLGPSSSAAIEESQADVLPPHSSRSPYPSSGISSSPAGSAVVSEVSDAAFQRLRLLAPTIKPGAIGSLRQPNVLSFWPTERGVGTQDYVSSIAIATEEKFSHAKRRLQRIEAKRKAQSEKYKRPAFMRQGFPASDGLGEDTITDMRPPPVQAMSSQQRIPDSSQSFGFPGPSVTMSQPVSGAFGDRKKAKKMKKKSGFR